MRSTGVVSKAHCFPTRKTGLIRHSGFYLIPELFPGANAGESATASNSAPPLLLGPFHGKPACQFIPLPAPDTTPTRPLGVCAAAFVSAKPTLVPDVDSFPGHIACDGETKSEIVLPLIQSGDHNSGAQRVLGVLDLDCLALGGFNEDDVEGLEKITQLLTKFCDWGR